MQERTSENNLAPLPADASLADIRAFFRNDRFATETTGCTIVEAAKGRAVCELALRDDHRNAMGNVMGGALFTLADFALAVACNVGEKPTVSIQSNIEFLSASRGSLLKATARAVKSGSHIGFYQVDIEDDLGRAIARMDATCYR